ncbi:hypothetical protein [Altererythrobacter litoralis]|uniref:Lipoprotein n=1 Tax=Altererythrobacter litoralis TaxID=3113904 RepID=A0ABU7GDY9_9SPHN|nr:hypothetical protein [Erythrobacteraceae bacterium 1XM1-14]
MRKIILVAAFAAVAACSQPEAPAEEATTEEAAAPTFDAAADGGVPYGNFKVTLADGTVQTEEVREDGTFTSTSASGDVETGTWVQKGNQYCTTLDAEGAVERCHTESIDENGVWVSVDPEGQTVTVERVEG